MAALQLLELLYIWAKVHLVRPGCLVLGVQVPVRIRDRIRVEVRVHRAIGILLHGSLQSNLTVNDDVACMNSLHSNVHVHSRTAPLLSMHSNCFDGG